MPSATVPSATVPAPTETAATVTADTRLVAGQPVIPAIVGAAPTGPASVDLPDGTGSVAGPTGFAAGDHGPLSAAQRRLWVLEQLNPGSVEYLVPLVLRLRGPLDPAALSAALGDLVARHDALRARYETRDDEPVMVVDPAGTVALAVEPTTEQDLAAVLDAEAQRGFDLATGPVWRARLLRPADDEHVLALHLHHIACDGWSASVLSTELGALYQARVTGIPAALPAASSYLAHARHEAATLADGGAPTALEWWRATLSGLPALDLPTDRPRTAPRDPAGRRTRFTVAAATAQAVTAAARRWRVTPFVVLLAGYAVLLARYSGQSDFAVGTPVSGRTRRDIEDTVGLFVNTLAVRCDLTGAPTFAELVARIRESTLGSMEHQDVPFDHVVRAVAPERDLTRPPLASALFVLEEDGGGVAAQLGSLTVEEQVVSPNAVKAEVSLGLRAGPDGRLYGAVDYATALFDQDTAGDFAQAYTRLLTAALAAPDRDVHDLDLLSEAAQAALAEVNATDAPLDPRPLHELVLAQADRTPDATAVVAPDGERSYRELVDRASAWSARLAATGVRRGDVVGICLHRQADLVTTMLGVLLAGAAYLPLDPEDPPARLAELAGAAGARAVVTDAEHAASFAALPILDVAAADPADPAATDYQTALTGAPPTRPPPSRRRCPAGTWPTCCTRPAPPAGRRR